MVAIVLTHCAVTLWHGATHRQIPVPLTTTQIVFVVATTALPLLGAGLLWTARKLAAIWFITVSLLAALLFGFINHFVVHSSSDYVLAVPAHAWGYWFILSAALLVVTDTLGIAIGVMAVLAWRRPA